MNICSVIIVNYRSSEDILKCLESAMQFETYKYQEWIIVDNDSKDNSKDQLIQKFPFIKWVDMNYNAGFARANNAGIRISSGDAILLLNPDTLIKDDAIAKCYKTFMESGNIACGVQLLNEDGSPQISGNYAMKGGLNYLLPLPYLGKFIRWVGKLLNVKEPNVPETSTETYVDWINGAFLMVKKNAIEKAGLLDEDFFLYAEEAEWCSRLKKFGRLCIYGQYNVVHLQGETANETFESAGKGYYNLYDRKGLQIMVSNFVRIRKEFGTGWFLIQLCIYSVTIPIFFIGICLEGIFIFENLRKNFTEFIGFTKNIVYLWNLAGKIISNKPFFYKVL